MKKLKLPVLGFGLMLLIASCKKNDAQYGTMPTNPATATAATSVVKASSDWKTATTWASSKHEKFTTYNSKIADSSITSAVTSSGLILAFAKNSNDVHALPYQQKGTSDAYWYYQVSKGAITFSCDVYSGSASVNTTTFQYFVLTAEQLKDLETKGHSKAELMQLSYENAAALLNK